MDREENNARALREAAEQLLEHCYRANFSNGVTDGTGSIDEGEVRAGESMDAMRKAILDADDETKLDDQIIKALDEAEALALPVDDEAKRIRAVQAALDDYDAALRNREHGGIAAHHCVDAVRRALAQPEQGGAT